MIHGVDLSDNNGLVVPELFALSPYDFAAVKVSEGVGYENKVYEEQLDAIRYGGKVPIHYLFARPDLDADPGVEADYFADTIIWKPGEPIAVDAEVGNGPLQDWFTTLINKLIARKLPRPMFYTGAWFAFPHLLHDNTDLAQSGLWLEQWTPVKQPITLPGWLFWAIWQYGQGNVLGINGMVDLNVFNGTKDQLHLYGTVPN